MTPNYDKMTILRIAKYYYLDELSQQEISEKENIHRSQISRILKLARELGYVQIRISGPESYTAEALAIKVKERTGLSEVYVATSLTARADQEDSLYFFAARYLEENLTHSKKIGIGQGKTLYHVASQLSAQKLEDRPDFYSVSGSSGTDNPYLQASVILDNFSRPFSGRCHYNNFPICMDRSRMSQLETSRFHELQEAYHTLDTVVLSIGGPFNIEYPYLEEFSLMEKGIDIAKALKRPHGNLLAHVFYDDNECLKLPDDYFITSMSLSLLARTPNVICIACGKEKVAPIISASRQKYIKTLITDESTARNILQESEMMN
jgi:DNA-binding transcriptional regulator LsrR (DeoR family)